MQVPCLSLHFISLPGDACSVFPGSAPCNSTITGTAETELSLAGLKHPFYVSVILLPRSQFVTNPFSSLLVFPTGLGCLQTAEGI